MDQQTTQTNKIQNVDSQTLLQSQNFEILQQLNQQKQMVQLNINEMRQQLVQLQSHVNPAFQQIL